MWNCFKVEPKQTFLLFLNMSHFELQPNPTQDEFLEFLQNTLWIWKRFQTEFFQRMGMRALSGPRKRNALAPHSLKKFGLKAILNSKYVLQKVKEFILSRVWLKFKMAHIQKSRKIFYWFNFEAVSHVLWRLLSKPPCSIL